MALTLLQELTGVRVECFEVDGLRASIDPAPLDSWIEKQLESARIETAQPEWEVRRDAVRGMLRAGGYKPSGRNKPAQEYLLRCLTDGNFPRIHPAVDCLNALSVRIGLPISMLTRDRFQDGVRLRLGRTGERYVFNASGQELELENLMVACGSVDAQEPLGSPVKDSMAGKIDETVSSIVCILYAPSAGVSETQLADWAAELERSIQRFATS
ncbi:MAG: hypothetical protein WCI02_18160 [Planctomycetota bacterium]